MALTADILRGYTDTIIMRQLSLGDSYGYRINKNIQEMSSGLMEFKEATLYTAFKRLENAGYICSYWGDEDTGARRRYYTLTPDGHTRLDEELNDWVRTRGVLDTLLTGGSL